MFNGKYISITEVLEEVYGDLKLQEQLPTSLRVRDRLLELQQELLSRQPSTIEGMIRQTTDNPIK